MQRSKLETGRKYCRAAAVNQRQRADSHSQLGTTGREGGGFNELVAAQAQSRLVARSLGWFSAETSCDSAPCRTLAGTATRLAAVFQRWDRATPRTSLFITSAHLCPLHLPSHLLIPLPHPALLSSTPAKLTHPRLNWC